MKLFLSSALLPPGLRSDFLKLVGKPAADTRLVLIENAADLYPPEKRGFVGRNEEELISAGLQPTILDLREYIGHPGQLEQVLSQFDVMCFSGGNTFYLRHLMKKVGLEPIIPRLLEKGIVYMGGSAGTVVAGPTLKFFEAMDSLDQAPEVIWEGLGLVDFIPLPHWNTPKYQEGLERLRENLLTLGKEVVTIMDDQVIIVENNVQRIVPG